MCLVLTLFFFFFVFFYSCSLFFFFLMIRRPPRSTLDRSSAASDVYKRQELKNRSVMSGNPSGSLPRYDSSHIKSVARNKSSEITARIAKSPVSYTHLRAHETVLDLVCRLLLEKKKKKTQVETYRMITYYNTTIHKNTW